MKPIHSRSAILFRRSLLAAALFAGCTAPTVHAVTYYWDNDGIAAGFGTAGGTWAAPTTGSATQGWSIDETGATLPADITTTTADTLNFGNGATGLATGSVTVSGTVDANKMVIASGSGAITLSGGTVALGGASPSITLNNTGNTISSALTLNANTSVIMGTATALLLNLNSSIGGTGNLTFTTTTTSLNNADQVIRLGASSNYSGTTTINTGNINNRLTVSLTTADALPATTVLTLDGGAGTGSGRNLYFDLNSKNQTLAGLTNVARSLRNQRIINTGSGNVSLTINNTNNYSFSGNIGAMTGTPSVNLATNLSLVKSGSGTQTLTAGNTYTGTTTINGGKLVGVVGGHHQNSDVTLGNVAATYGVSISDNTKSWKCKSLATTAAGTLEFNFGAVEPSASVSPLLVTEVADFTATPSVSVVVSTSLAPGTYPLMTWGSTAGTAPTTDQLTVSQLPFGSTAELQVSGNTLNLVVTSNLTYIVKENNTNNLNLGSSWVGGTAPATTDIAKWNGTVTSANSTLLGTDLTWAGLVIENPTGPVTIGTGNTLTLGAADTDIDLSAATADLTLNCPLSLGDANNWDVATGRTLTVSGGVSGAFPVTKKGTGTAILSGTNTYTGNTTVSAGLLKLAAADVIPNGTGTGNLSVSGTLDLNGFSESVNGLSGAGIVDNVAIGSPVTLTVGDNDTSSTFTGVLQNTGGTLNLVKTGTGVVALGGANTMSGSVTVNGGTLALDNTAPFGSASGISMAADTTLRPKLTATTVGVPISLGPVGTNATITAPLFPDSNTGAGTPRTVDIEGAVSGDGNLTLLGVNTFNQYGTIILSAPCTYSGSTLVTTNNGNANIFVQLDTENALPTTTVLTLDGGGGAGSSPGRYCQVDLFGNNQTLAGLTNVSGLNLRVQRIINSSASAATLTVNNTADFTYTAQLGNGGTNMGLTKSGTGTLTLSGSNAYTGATIITGGKLALGASNVLADVTEVSIGAGTLAIDGGFSDTVATLDATAAATINLGAGATLAFANSNAVEWTGGSLTITGAFVSGVSLRFGKDATGLTPTQIASISGPGLSDIAINSEGFLTATVTGGYTTWATTNAGGQSADLDFDNDGVTNGVEYFMNAAAGFTANPQLNGSNTITWPNGGNIPASAYGTQFVIQTSSNLQNWTDVPIGSLTLNTDGPGGSLTYTLTGTAPRFVRLVVTP